MTPVTMNPIDAEPIIEAPLTAAVAEAASAIIDLVACANLTSLTAVPDTLNVGITLSPAATSFRVADPAATIGGILAEPDVAESWVAAAVDLTGGIVADP